MFFCHTFTWISHGCTCVPRPEPPSHLSPHPIPRVHPSVPALSTLSHALNLDWWSVSHMIIYTFQCFIYAVFVTFDSCVLHLCFPPAPKCQGFYSCCICRIWNLLNEWLTVKSIECIYSGSFISQKCFEHSLLTSLMYMSTIIIFMPFLGMCLTLSCLPDFDCAVPVTCTAVYLPLYRNRFLII